MYTAITSNNPIEIQVKMINKAILNLLQRDSALHIQPIKAPITKPLAKNKSHEAVANTYFNKNILSPVNRKAKSAEQ